MRQIKIALENQIKNIYNLCEKVKKTYPLWDSDYPTYEDFVYEYNNGLILYYEEDDNIVGSLTIEYGMEDFPEFSSAISFCKFMVEEAYRKKGIGKSLFDMGEKIAIDKGYREIVFLVHKDNEKAMNLYQKWGYQKIGRYDVPWVDNVNEYYYLFKKHLCK